jgi:hypothetical protein
LLIRREIYWVLESARVTSDHLNRNRRPKWCDGNRPALAQRRTVSGVTLSRCATISLVMKPSSNAPDVLTCDAGVAIGKSTPLGVEVFIKGFKR